MASKNVNFENMLQPKATVYLPSEGLQGEDIPSNIVWQGLEIAFIRISFSSPLKVKEVFNATSWDSKESVIIANGIEVEGYFGLSFETTKVKEIQTETSVFYELHLKNGSVINETKKIVLFRPQLEVKVDTDKVEIDPKTMFVKNRIRMKNVGRGVLMLRISTTDSSQFKIETPPEHREFAERFEEDLTEELSILAKTYPQFKQVWDQVLIWDTKDFQEFTKEDRVEFSKHINRLAHVLASDKRLLQAFVEAYAKTLAKNSEFIEKIRKVIAVYESLVSKDMILLNPLDEIILSAKKGEVTFAVSQADRVLDDYEKVFLPKIELLGSEGLRIPVYRLFGWC
jgi:hypothetical protein